VTISAPSPRSIQTYGWVLFLQICGHLLDFGQIPLRWLFPKPRKQDPLPFLELENSSYRSIERVECAIRRPGRRLEKWDLSPDSLKVVEYNLFFNKANSFSVTKGEIEGIKG